MTAMPEADLEAARAALRAWGVFATAIEPLGGGPVNEHWLVERSTESPLVLRRDRERHDPAGTAYEHDLLAFLAGRGWPVAAPLADADGATTVVTEAGRWSLFPYLRGEPPPREDRTLLRKGALLALLHADLREWHSRGQRPGFARVSDLDAYVRPDGYASYDELLGWFEAHDPEHAATLDRTLRRNRQALQRLGYDELPNVVIHNECLGNNVLFEGDTVTAILDFDFVHEDARVADIGRSLVVDCGPDRERVRHWLTGYAAHADPPLSAVEANLVPDLMIANAIWNAAVPLSIASRTGDALMVESARDVIEELPVLEAARRDLRRLAGAVVRSPEPGIVEEPEE